MVAKLERQAQYFEKTSKLFSDAGCIPLETQYKPAKQKWKFICECGSYGEILPDDFKRGRRCAQCTHTRRSLAKRLDTSEVREFFETKDEKLLDVHFLNGRTMCSYLCKRGHFLTREFYKYKCGTVCRKCAEMDASERLKFTIDDVRKIFEDNGCELLSTEYTHYDQKLKYKCSCGNVSYSYISSIKRGIKCGCQRLRGEDNPNWNSDKTMQERLENRQYPEYYEWVKAVYKRDNYTCKRCMEYGGKLNAHHILGFAGHQSLRTELSNGVTLCETCHKEFHKKYGLRNFTKENLENFIEEAELCRQLT